MNVKTKAKKDAFQASLKERNDQVLAPLQNFVNSRTFSLFYNLGHYLLLLVFFSFFHFHGLLHFVHLHAPISTERECILYYNCIAAISL
jgi:hypothetical protein